MGPLDFDKPAMMVKPDPRKIAKEVPGENCFSLEKISRIRDGVSMYPAFPTLHNSRQTVIGSRTSSRRCEQTTKSNVLSGNGQGELHTSCTIQVSAVKRSSSSGSRASSTRRDS